MQQSWIDTIQSEWFSCVSQKSLAPACAQYYISTISRLSHKLLDLLINLQDEKVNLHTQVVSVYGTVELSKAKYVQ